MSEAAFGGFEHAWALLNEDARRWLLDHRFEQPPEWMRDQLFGVGLMHRTEWVGHDGGPSVWSLMPGFEDFLDRKRDTNP